MLDAHPLSVVLISMPGAGARTATRILLEVGDGSAFKSAGHLAAYAGIARVTHRSGTSIRGEYPPIRKQKAQTRLVPLGLRSSARPDQSLLLRP